MISNLQGLQNLLKHIATLDAIISPEWEYRYYSYNSNWGKKEEMGSMRNGSGSEWFFLIKDNNFAGFKYFDPSIESSIQLAEIHKDFPSDLQSFLKEPAFSMSDISIVGFNSKNHWNLFGNPIDSFDDLEILNGNIETYATWASQYYEKELPLNSLQYVYNGGIITNDIVQSLNSEITIKDIADDLSEIGCKYEE
jgi:hypothetical protein